MKCGGFERKVPAFGRLRRSSGLGTEQCGSASAMLNCWPRARARRPASQLPSSSSFVRQRASRGYGRTTIFPPALFSSIQRCASTLWPAVAFVSLPLCPVERRCTLADLLKRHFETAKLLRAQFGEHSLHLAGMLSKRGNNEILATRGEGDDTNTSVFRALDPGYQALREETVHSDTDRAWGQIDDRADRVDGQRPFVQQEFQHAEIRETESGFFNTSGCVPRQGAHRLHHY